MATDKNLAPVRWPYDALNTPFAARGQRYEPPPAGIQDSPYVCVRVNLFWIPHLLGFLAAGLQLDAWAGADDGWAGRQEIERLMRALNDLTGCVSLGENTLLRQNPANACQLQQSQDGGLSWSLAFDFSRCRPNSPMENLRFYTDIQNTLNTYNQTWNNNPTVPAFTPELVYDSSGPDNARRDAALCFALGTLYDSIMEYHLEAVANPPARPLFEIVLTLGFAIAGGLIASLGTGGAATPVAAAAIVGAIGNAAIALGITAIVELNRADFLNARADVLCCMYNNLKGETPTVANFQAAAGCQFPPGAAANVAAQLSQYLQSQDVYLSFLKHMEDAYGISELIDLPPCPCESWEYTFDSATLPPWVIMQNGSVSGTTIFSDEISAFGYQIWAISINVEFPQPVTITGITIEKTAGNVTGAGVVNRFYEYRNSTGNTLHGGNLPIQDAQWIVDDAVRVEGVANIAVQYLFITPPATQSTMFITLKGAGSNPFV